MTRTPDPELGVPHLDSRSRWTDIFCIAAYCYCFLVFGLQVNLLGPTARELAASLQVVEADLGVIFTLNGFISIIGAVPAGWAVDKLPGHVVLTVSLAAEAAGFLLLPRASSLVGLAVVFGGVAFTWNFLNTAGNTYILWINRQQQGDGVLINLVNALFGAGSLAAPLVAELCQQGLGTSLSSYTLTAALTALSAASFCLLPSPKKPPEAGGTGGDQLQRSSGGGGGGRGGVEQQQQEGEEQRQPLLAGHVVHRPGEGPEQVEGHGRHFGGVGDAPEQQDEQAAAAVGDFTEHSWTAGGHLSALLVVVGVFVWVGVGLEVAFGNWIFTYSVQQLHMSEQAGHYVNAAYWAAFTGGRVIASFAAAVVKPAPMLLVSMPLAVVGSAVALLCPPDVLLSHEGGVIAGVAVLVGFGVSTAFANALSLLDSYAPVTGTVTGLLGALAGAGCMVFPLVVALLAKHTQVGYQGLMWVTLGSMAAMFVCLGAAMVVGARVKKQRRALQAELE